MTIKLLLCSLALLTATPGAYASSGCSLPYEQVLAKARFAELENCRSGGQVTAEIAGIIHTARHAYAVLDFRYWTKPINGGVSHGGQRILIIEDGRHFVGQYALSPPPSHFVSILGKSILIDVPKEHGNIITFTESGPPPRAYLDQEPVLFSR